MPELVDFAVEVWVALEPPTIVEFRYTPTRKAITTTGAAVTNTLKFVLFVFNEDSPLIRLRGYIILCSARFVLGTRTN